MSNSGTKMAIIPSKEKYN